MTGNNRIRILHLRATQFQGGPEKQILDHAIRVSSSGPEIWLGSFRDGYARPEFLERAERAGLPTIELSSGRFDPRTILELARVMRRNRISLLCTHGYKANILGWAASRLTGCSQIAFVRGWTRENWRIKIYERLERLILAWTDWTVCVSRPLMEELRKRRTGRTPPCLIPNCSLIPSEASTLPIDRRPFREALGLAPDSFCVCAAGRLSPEKGHRHLIAAVPMMVRRIPKLHVLVLGNGKERDKLEEQARRLGVPGRVTFAGFKTDIRPWIQGSDVLVNPSLTEGTPNVVLEAMALGTPVVATGVGGVPEVVEDLVSGLLVPPGEPAALAEAILDIFSRPSETLRLADNARKRLAMYSPQRQDQQLIELYAKALPQSAQLGLAGNRAVLPVES